MQTTPPLSIHDRQRLVTRAAYASTGVAIILIIAKAIAVVATGSTAVLGSLLDSLLDVGASILNLIAVRHAMTPADDAHRFGHGKVEALAGLGQAAFVAIAAILLGWRAIDGILHPAPVAQSAIGIGVMIFAIVATLALVAYQRSVIRRTQSTAIAADALHYAGDVLLNGSVALSLILGALIDVPWLDGVAGIAIAGFIIVGSVRIVLQSADELMDRELPREDREQIRALALDDPAVVDAHDIRTRRAGQRIFVELHLEMDGDLTLTAAHTIADRAMARIERAYPHADVLIHQDPAGIEERRQEID